MYACAYAAGRKHGSTTDMKQSSNLQEICMRQYKAASRIQAACRGYLWRKHTLHNPHTSVGQQWLCLQAQQACRQPITPAELAVGS